MDNHGGFSSIIWQINYKKSYKQLVVAKLHVNCRVHIVDISLVQFLTKVLNRFTNTGNMKYRKRAANTYYWVTVP